MPTLPRRIVISPSGDIGRALAVNWLAAGCEIHGDFSTAGDASGDAHLDKLLLNDPDMYKLRRSGNGRLAA